MSLDFSYQSQAKLTMKKAKQIEFYLEKQAQKRKL